MKQLSKSSECRRGERFLPALAGQRVNSSRQEVIKAKDLLRIEMLLVKTPTMAKDSF
jgi:hypothetical protein